MRYPAGRLLLPLNPRPAFRADAAGVAGEVVAAGAAVAEKVGAGQQPNCSSEALEWSGQFERVTYRLDDVFMYADFVTIISRSASRASSLSMRLR